jgi:4-hydroxy-tetrahydrodipicolinate reductase
MIKLAIIGAAGRMGRRIAALAIESEQFDVVAAIDCAGCDDLGKDMGTLAGLGKFGLALSDNLDALDADDWPDVAIDFSMPEGTMHWLAILRQKGIPVVIGTTGLTESHQAELADTASHIPIVFAGNYSLGINLLCKLVAQAAAALGGDYDVEISETHHRFKQDAPSGTAIMLARSVCEATGRDYSQSVTHGRCGREARKPGEIGMHAIRLGDTVGEHSVSFGSLGETITLSHSAHTRDTFARGALRAARWVLGQGPGQYDMAAVLGL